MKERLEKRLGELRAELEQGERMIADLQARQNQIRETLLRISGAVQVLEEELAREEEGAATDPMGPQANGTHASGVQEFGTPSADLPEPAMSVSTTAEPPPPAWP